MSDRIETFKKLNVRGSLVLTVSEDRLEKDEEVTAEYVAEVLYKVFDEKDFPEEKIEKQFFTAAEKVFGKRGEKKYMPRMVINPSLSKEIKIADELNAFFEESGEIEIFSVYFESYKIREEDLEKIAESLKPRPEEMLFR